MTIVDVGYILVRLKLKETYYAHFQVHSFIFGYH